MLITIFRTLKRNSDCVLLTGVAVGFNDFFVVVFARGGLCKPGRRTGRDGSQSLSVHIYDSA